MGKRLIVNGGQKLHGGKIAIAGSSNQVTKCILTSLLTNEPVIIKGAPVVNERFIAEELFTHLGGQVEHLDDNTIRLCANNVSNNSITKEICQRNRISILAAGPLLHRFRSAKIYATLGGDKIGKRPVDFHIKGLEQMGVTVSLENDIYHMTVDEDGLQGAHIILPFPSVMTTENLLVAATLAKGRTIIENAAIEPEIIELVKMLQKMGADIMINANRTYIIQGVKKLKGCELRVMLDRNEAVSFACAALATGGDILLEKIPHDPLYSFLNFIQRMGAEFRVNSSGIFITAPKKLKHSHIEIEVHPGFMTDWQQPFMVLFTQAHGISVLHETIFENRLNYTNFLNEMGANIHLHSACLGEIPCRFKSKNHLHSAIIYGPTPLFAKDFKLPTDIRAAMSLVIAGLVATGKSCFTNVAELQRKYDNIVTKLQSLGADVLWGE